MTDTPQYIKDIHLKLWLEKPLEERLYQTIKDIEEMRHALRELKREMGLPLDDLDPVGEYLRKKKEKADQIK
jgi:hypothetical protein